MYLNKTDIKICVYKKINALQCKQLLNNFAREKETRNCLVAVEITFFPCSVTVQRDQSIK